MSQPAWHSPPQPEAHVRDRLPKLALYNSLAKTKTPFVPLDPTGKVVSWYACGPTVYDDAHLGHARNYVSTDIIRRILQDYFKFDVNFVMNITDVDDKIILAARQRHLLDQWLESHKSLNSDVRDTIDKAFQAYLRKNLPLIPASTSYVTYDADVKQSYGHVLAGKPLESDAKEPGDREAKVKMHIDSARSTAKTSLIDGVDWQTLVNGSTSVLLPYLDSLHGSSIDGNDHAMFTKLTKRYEDRFFVDMDSLNVRRPDKVTRVTEYGTQIVDFVKHIQENGFAYETEGSVYFDVGKWESSGGMYARLKPESKANSALQADGEGSLANKQASGKRSPADFALWKASKAGEPYWDSPWGKGRPGWHIECSAMASEVIGRQVDIHSGGIDLAFPHHDNELVQSEAYWCNHDHIDPSAQWVNYFLHMGHLGIQGMKMSKSLKNFTTIKEAFAQDKWTARTLRIIFLQAAWKEPLEITDGTVNGAISWEERLDNFFLKAIEIQKGSGAPELANLSISANDTNKTISSLQHELEIAQQNFREALCDSFDTPTALLSVSKLITAYNSASDVPHTTTFHIAQWLTEIVNMFGLDMEPARPGQIGWSGIEVPSQALPFVEPLSALRDQIRGQAKAKSIDSSSLKELPKLVAQGPETEQYAKAYLDFSGRVQELRTLNAPAGEWLAACDHLRNNTFPDIGLWLEDRDNQPSFIRKLSASLRKEHQERKATAAAKANPGAIAAAKAAKEAEKEAKRAEKEAKEKADLEKGRLSHLEMFKTKEYSEWDAEGLPTKDAEGNEVTKSRGKTLKKQWTIQKKAHEKWLASQGA